MTIANLFSQNVIGAVLACALIGYLFVALIRPEKF